MKISANTIFVPGSTSGIGLALALALQAKGNTDRRRVTSPCRWTNSSMRWSGYWRLNPTPPRSKWSR
jgi:hypothetical protein